jgi:hypothetical protein
MPSGGLVFNQFNQVNQVLKNFQVNRVPIIVPRLNIKQLGIPKYFGKIPKRTLCLVFKLPGYIFC